MIKFILTNSSYFATLENKNNEALYFIEDTHELYKGSESYSDSVIFVDEFPELAAKGKLYVLNSTLECKIHNGTTWISLVPQIQTTLTDEITNHGLVTAEAIKAYVIKKVSDIVAGGDVNLDTDNIVTTREIEIKGQTLGSYKDGDVIPVGESLTNILVKQFAKQIPPTYNRPSISVTPGSSTHESGTIIERIPFNTTFNKNDGGDVTKHKVVVIENNGTPNETVADTITPYEFNNITVHDGGVNKFKSTVEYADGPIKNDNLGMAYPTGSIKAGSVQSETILTGQRKAFYARDNKTAAVTTSAEVRALTQSSMNPGNGTKIVLNISAGDTRLTFAYPDTLRDVSSVISSALNLDVKGTFVKSSIDVEGANGYKAIGYKVYTYIPAIPFTSNDTYTVTI